MNKKITYWILVILVVIGIFILWKKEESKNEEMKQNTNSISIKSNIPSPDIENINKINISSGIDEDMKTLDTDIKTL